MPQSLYQKYRPQVWTELADQPHIASTLQQEIIRGEISHSYLFVGPRGVGKTTTARLLAKAVNCTNRKKDVAEPCGQCDACVRVQSGRSFDIIEIDAASHTGVDHVREHIVNAAEVYAGHGAYRVFIIDEVHMLSTSAFNALLKTLEEPPAHVIFILATTEVHKVPATIISRCQRFDFHKVSKAAIKARLLRLIKEEGVQIEPDVVGLIADRAEGSLRDAESVLGQVLSIGGKKITLEDAALVVPRSQLNEASKFIGLCLSGEASEALLVVNKLAEEGVAMNVFMGDCLKWLRLLFVASVAEKIDETIKSEVGELVEILNEQITQASAATIMKMLDIFLVRSSRLIETPLPQMPLEMAAVEASLLASARDEHITND